MAHRIMQGRKDHLFLIARPGRAFGPAPSQHGRTFQPPTRQAASVGISGAIPSATGCGFFLKIRSRADNAIGPVFRSLNRPKVGLERQCSLLAPRGTCPSDQ